MNSSGKAESIKQRLLNRAHAEGEVFNLLLTRYGCERLLYRMGRSSRAKKFCLKGAQLFAAWTGQLHRATKDIDFLSFGSPKPEDVAEQIRFILEESESSFADDDGIYFDIESIKAREIREDQEYGGVRITVIAYLGKARIPIQMDFGFGDSITPHPVELELPVLLGDPPPRLLCYPLPTAIAEKTEAITSLGLGNSRLKDFYDLWTIARMFRPELSETVQAIINTFARWETRIERSPAGLSELFWGQDQVKSRWKAFVKKTLVGAEPVSVDEMLSTLHAFLNPVLDGAFHGLQDLSGQWDPEVQSWNCSTSDNLGTIIEKLDASLGRNAKPLEVALALELTLSKSSNGTILVFCGKTIRLETWGNLVRKNRLKK